MNLTLRNSTPIKYKLGLHQVLPNYPTEQDFVFDLLAYITKVTISKSNKFDSTDLKFSSKTLKQVFGDKLTEDFIIKIKLFIKNLIEEGIFTKIDDYVNINESEFFKYYEISN